MALNSGIQTYQILTNDDEICIPSLSSILIAVSFGIWLKTIPTKKKKCVDSLTNLKLREITEAFR